MDPITIFFMLWALAQGSSSKILQSVNAYKIPNWAINVIDIAGVSLVLAEEVGFVTDGTNILKLRYGTLDKAKWHLPHLTDNNPHEQTEATYYYPPLNATVIRSPHVATIVFDKDNIATVESGHFLGHCFQGTPQSCSSLITKILAAGVNLSKAQEPASRKVAGARIGEYVDD